MLDLVDASAPLVFFTSAVGVVPAAALMSEATEQLAERSGPGIAGTTEGGGQSGATAPSRRPRPRTPRAAMKAINRLRSCLALPSRNAAGQYSLSTGWGAARSAIVEPAMKTRDLSEPVPHR